MPAHVECIYTAIASLGWTANNLLTVSKLPGDANHSASLRAWHPSAICGRARAVARSSANPGRGRDLGLGTISLASIAATGAQTLKMIRILRNSTRKSALEVLKGLSRQERKRLTEELVRASNPGLSNHEIRVLIGRNILPKGVTKRMSNDAISSGVRKQLLESVNASLGIVGSATGGLMSQIGPTGKFSDLLFGVVNAYETM